MRIYSGSAPLIFKTMASVQEMIQRLQGVRERIKSVPEIVGAVANAHKDELLSLNKDQMLLGRKSTGGLFKPSYLSDPYFKTKTQAQAYAQMKYRLEGIHKSRIEHVLGYPDKPKNTPNLIVTGPFQDNMYITFNGNGFTIGSTYQDSGAIESKYNNAVFGLAPLSREWFYKIYLFDAIRQHIYGYGV